MRVSSILLGSPPKTHVGFHKILISWPDFSLSSCFKYFIASKLASISDTCNIYSHLTMTDYDFLPNKFTRNATESESIQLWRCIYIYMYTYIYIHEASWSIMKLLTYLPPLCPRFPHCRPGMVSHSEAEALVQPRPFRWRLYATVSIHKYRIDV